MKNKWKWLFLMLLTLNIAVILLISILIFDTPEDVQDPEINIKTENMSEFTISTDKHDLNRLINHYIEKEGLNGPINYYIKLTDEVELFGEIKVFSKTLQLRMTFEPQALENGDLLLVQKSLSLGGIKLPVERILKFIQDGYKLPEWVIIQPNDKKIYVALQEMRLNGGIQVRAEEFDVAKNNISMRMLVPVSQ